MTALGLTQRERDALDFITSYIGQHRIAPSYDDIRAGLNLKSKSGVTRLIGALEERGHIARLHGHGRSIALTGVRRPRPAPPALPPKVQAELDRYCLANGEAPEAVIADAVTLFIDEMERETAA